MNRYGYANHGIIKNFQCLRTLCYWAACFGLVQSLIWIGLTLTGILAYNCVITIEDTFNYSSVVKTIFMALYFRGSCPAADLPTYTNIITVKTILDPKDILIWESVYLGVCVCWLIASGLLIAYVKKDNRKLTASVVLSWVIITFLICAMDFSLGVIFGVDYGRFNTEAAKHNLSSSYSGPVDAQGAQLLAAMVVSISMMIMSLKGFILWIINAAFMVYLLIQAVLILTDNEVAENLFMSCTDSEDVISTRPPINAYGEEKKIDLISTVFASNEAFVPDDPPPTVNGINQEVLSRAARMSMDTSLQERRFRNLDNFQQYPPRQRPESSIPDMSQPPISPNGAVMAAFPAPDYTPPMQRAARNASRNQRFQ